MPRLRVHSLSLIVALVAFAIAVLAPCAALAQDRLQPKTPVQRELAPKGSHEYVVTTGANQRFVVEAQQKGIDIVLTVLAPDGKQVSLSDSASEEQGTGGTERAEVNAVDAGDYRVKIVAFARPDAKPGTFIVTLADVRDLTAEEVANARSEKEILAIEDEWERAIDKADVATLSRILHDDGFQLAPVASATRTRQQLIAGWQEGAKQQAKGTTQEHTLSERVIKAAGSTAVSTGRAVITTTTKEGPNRFSGQFLHVWAKDAKGWRLVGDHFYPYGRVPREKGAPVKVDAAVLAAYAGTYRPEHATSTVTMAVENGALMAQWTVPGQPSFPKTPLEAVNDTTFLSFGDELVFVRAPDGRVHEIIILSDGPAARATRIDDPGSR